MGVVSYIKQGDRVIIGHEGETYTVGPDHVNYEAVQQAIAQGRRNDLPDLANVAKAVESYIKGDIRIEDGVVYYGEQVVHNVVADRIVDLMQAGEEIDPLIVFLENLLDNPAEYAVKEMYLFMECNNIAITPDGHFLAYKAVRRDYLDHHSATLDNSVGKVVEMDRGEVDPVRDRLCSHGLHFCGLSYIRSVPGYRGNGSRLMLVKINPRDVVSIPSDYNNAKGRCCRYEVVAEVDGEGRHDQEAFGLINRDHSEIAPSVDDIAEFKKTGQSGGLRSFFEGLFNWMGKR